MPPPLSAAWATLAGLAASTIAVEAPGPTGPLRGTLVTPARERAPVALIIPGSGPTDRDGDNPRGVKAAPYRLLADALAQRGIATLRIDKRGMFGSTGAVPDANAVTIEDYVADVRQWATVARRRTGAPCVWLLGHSEGGLVALAARGKVDGICGLILVATAGRPIGAVIREQLRANPANAPLLDQAETALAGLEAGKRVDNGALHPALLPLFDPAVQGFLISTLALDPAALIAEWRTPILIVQGTRDMQVSVTDAQRLHAAAKGSTLALVANANHVLKTVASGDRSANLATYADPNLPLADGVAEPIASFILGQGGQAGHAPHGASSGGR